MKAQEKDLVVAQTALAPAQAEGPQHCQEQQLEAAQWPAPGPRHCIVVAVP